MKQQTNEISWRERVEPEVYTEIQDCEITEDVMKIIEQDRIRAKIEVYEEIEKMCSNQFPEHEHIWKNCYRGIKALKEQLK